MLKSIRLKTICYLFFIFLIYTACTDTSTAEPVNGADSIKQGSDSSVKAAENLNEYNEEEDMKKLVMEFSQICENPVTKDTLFVIGSDSISVAFNHSCTGDSFPIPAKYLEPYKMDRFMAHSLISDITVEKNGVRMLNKRIEKKDFESVCDGALKEYAVLLYPGLGITGDTIYADYSLSIPLTDVGIGVRASILKDGSIHFGTN